MTQFVSRRPVAAPHFGFSVFSQLFNALETYRQRQALSKLDAQRLDDLGLTKADIAREMSRPIWS